MSVFPRHCRDHVEVWVFGGCVMSAYPFMFAVGVYVSVCARIAVRA